MAGYTQNSAGGYSVNYEDERFKEVTNEQAQREAETTQIYDNMLNNSDQHYQNQIDATKDYANKQSELQQAQTDFAIQQIEQQKEKAQQDYTKEQKGAYVDYMKQTKSNAQNMANSGLSNTGYSESSIVSMYNQYQNRVGTAKESLNNTIMNYNNGIQQAILANNEKLAEIAFNALQTENQLNQQAFEYKNSLLLQKEQALQEINDTYYARYQNVLAQINSEIELQMELDRIDREYEMWLKEFTEQHNQWQAEFEESKKQWAKEIALTEKQVNAAIATEQAQAAYYRAQASALNNSVNFTDGDGNKPGTTGTGKLGDYANGLLTDIQKYLNKYATSDTTTPAGKILTSPFNTMNKETARMRINSEYNKNKITLEEAEILFTKLGLN